MLLSKEVIYYDFGDFRIDVLGERLLKNGTPQPLTHKAFLTLVILVRNAGQIVEKEQIISEIWNDSFVEESNLSQYIYVLRKLLGTDANGSPYIETITRRGFRFTARVVEVSAKRKADDEMTGPETAAPNTLQVETNLNQNGFLPHPANEAAVEEKKSPAEETVKDAREEELTPKAATENNHRRIRFLLITLLVLTIFFAAAYLYKNHQASSQPASSNTKSIAVLPFKTIGSETNNEKLGFGMADAIITRLGQTKQITVRPTSAIFRYTDSASTDSVAVGRELQVDAVLEGTIQRDQDRVRVSVSLINVASGESVWAETFNEKFTNIFDLQDSISSSVAKSLSVNLTPQEQGAQRQTSQTEAYQAYLLGVYFWNKRTREDLEKGVANFQRAIELDPNYAQAYAGLADCYNLLGYYGHTDRQEMRKKGREAAEKALALNDSLAEAHIAMAFVQNDQEKSRHFLERAIELAPNNSTARVRYGWNLLNANNPETLEAAEKQMRLAQEYDPLSFVSNGALCSVLMFRRNYDEAIKYCEKSMELSPNAAQGHLSVADALFFKGQHEQAIAKVKAEIDKGRNADAALGTLAHYYAMLGRHAEAEKILAELKPKAEKNNRLILDLILISYALGKKDESIGYFKQAHEKRILPLFINFDPIWTEVVKDEEIRKIYKSKEN
jgi:TolB-like protein/DNA-binding winged helix-turn-helix (wHTH) protein/cytochrome c-type biogenesis protein CcmH/NrfG